MTPPTAEGGSLRAQDLQTPGDPVGLDGSVIRVDPTTGQGVPSNPLAASSDANARRIVAYGFRNPFRFTLRPGTNDLWIGDVGLNTWEEIDRLANPAAKTILDFGWPCYEASPQQPLWASLGLDICTNLYAAGTARGPYFAYNHARPVVPGDGCPTGHDSLQALPSHQAMPRHTPEHCSSPTSAVTASGPCCWEQMGCQTAPRSCRSSTAQPARGPRGRPRRRLVLRRPQRRHHPPPPHELGRLAEHVSVSIAARMFR